LDTDPTNPREEEENLGTMVCWHKRYNLGDPHEWTVEDFQNYLEHGQDKVVFPLYLYDHSGLTISITPFQCPWDSGQVGWIYTTRHEIRRWFGVERVSTKLLLRAKMVLMHEVQTYDAYLRGEVYGYRLYRKSFCDSCGQTTLSLEDSCWGYYDLNDLKSSLPDELLKHPV